MSYTVKVVFETGDSYNSRIETDYVEMSWESKELARQAMREVVEHAEFSENMYDEGIAEEFHHKSWWVDEYSGFVLKLETDSGERRKVTVPWTGYFESIIRADVVPSDEDEDRILARGY